MAEATDFGEVLAALLSGDLEKQAVLRRQGYEAGEMADCPELQVDSEGYIPKWTTREMCAGSKSVQQHLIEAPHYQDAEMVVGLSISDCHRLHDRLHAEAGDDKRALLAQLLKSFDFSSSEE